MDIEPVKTDRDLKIAVVGLRQGNNHIDALAQLPNCRVTAICDTQADRFERAQNTLKTHGAAPAEQYASLDELLECAADFDAISLALPIAANGPASVRCLEAGLHTFCEKPIANRMADALKVKQTAESTGLVYQVGFELRHSPLMRAVMEHIHAGRIGTVTAINAIHYWRPNIEHIAARPWGHDKWSGNVLFDCMSHTFDLINLLAGGKVHRVFADTSRVTQAFADREIPEAGAVTIAYDNHVRAGVTFSETCGMPRTTIIQVAGDNGRIDIDFSNAGFYDLWFKPQVFHKREAFDPTQTAGGHLGWQEQFMDFRNAIVEGRKSFADADVGVESLLVSLGAVLSDDAGKPLERQRLLGHT